MQQGKRLQIELQSVFLLFGRSRNIIDASGTAVKLYTILHFVTNRTFKTIIVFQHHSLHFKHSKKFKFLLTHQDRTFFSNKLSETVQRHFMKHKSSTCKRINNGREKLNFLPYDWWVFLTGVSRNFHWEGPKMEKSCDLSLATFFSDLITATSLKWCHN